jgi:3D-(3,5/4)-trihydroxycyclohexane-1,2-dione acylhydrolase (decyclizing)
VHHIERRPPDPQRSAQARALIARKRRPLVVCGGGVRYSGAHEAFREFVETLHAVCRNPGREGGAGK